MAKAGDVIGGWRLECGCVHELLHIDRGFHESAHCPLHAAAPALLEALEMMVENDVDAAHGRRLRHPGIATLDKARAALRAAKGESA